MEVSKVRTFTDFNEDNDPHGEHDFGIVEASGRRVFWKIDLYEEPGVKGRDGEAAVLHVLTISLAEEY